MTQAAGMTTEFQQDGDRQTATLATPGSTATITVEQVLYVAVFVMGATVRFWGLARMPLDVVEALNSLAAWQQAFAIPWPVGLVPDSPLFLHLQTLLFWVGVNGDAAARVVSAAAGSLFVLVPWIFRRLLGRTTALVLALLFAVDPWLVAFSRLADATMTSTLLAVMLLGILTVLALDGSSGARAKSNHWRNHSIMAAIVAGLFVTSGPMAWTYSPVIIVFALLNLSALRRTIVVNNVVIVAFVAAFLAGASTWFIYPGNVGLISRSLTEWVDTLLLGEGSSMATVLRGSYDIGWSLRTLLADQPFLTLFGLIGLVLLTWRTRLGHTDSVRFVTVLWLWLAWGVLLNLLPGRSPISLLVLALPLLFGAADTVGRILRSAPFGENGREALAVVGTLLLLMVSAGFWAASLAASPALDMLAFQALLLLLLLMAAILVFFGVWSGWREAIWTGAVAFGVALLMVNIGATWRINHRFEPGRPGGLFSISSDLGIRELAADIQQLSAQRAGDPHELPVVLQSATTESAGMDAQMHPAYGVSARRVLLGWYLRDMRRLYFEDSGQAMELTRAPLVISGPEDGGHPALLDGKDYVGTEYMIISEHPSARVGEAVVEESPTSVQQRLESAWSRNVQPWLRWALYRSGVSPAATDSVTLWAPQEE